MLVASTSAVSGDDRVHKFLAASIALHTNWHWPMWFANCTVDMAVVQIMAQVHHQYPTYDLNWITVAIINENYETVYASGGVPNPEPPCLN